MISVKTGLGLEAFQKCRLKKMEPLSERPWGKEKCFGSMHIKDSKVDSIQVEEDVPKARAEELN